MRRDWLVPLGLAVVCVAAVVASFSTLASLAAFTGWGERSSWLLPASLDALAMVACRVWLSSSAPERARRYARDTTLVAVGLSILGNAAGHLATTGHLSQGLALVVLVGAVPPAALAAVVHLAVLVSSPVPVGRRSRASSWDAVPVPAAKPSSAPAPSSIPVKKTAPSPKPVPRPKVERGEKVEDESAVSEFDMQRGRHADRAYRAENDGKPITRDGLKAAGFGTTKATKILAALKREREAA